MKGVGHTLAVIQGGASSASASASGNSTPFHKPCKDCDRKECDRKVRFEDRARSVRTITTPKHQMPDKIAEKPRPCRPPDGVIIKDQQTGELLLPFGDNSLANNSAQQKLSQKKQLTDAEQDQEIRLRGKLKWLFEQDRMFWESNSAKSSRRGSPECDRSRSLNSLSGPTKPAVVDSPNDAKLVRVVEESFKRACSSKKPPVNKLKPPRQQQQQPQQTSEKVEKVEKVVVSRVESLSTNRHSSPAKVPWTFSSSSVKFWPRGRSKNSTNVPNITPVSNISNVPNVPNVPHNPNISNGETKVRVPPVRQNLLDHSKRTNTSENNVTLPHSSLAEILTDYDDAPKSGESSEIVTSDEEEEMRKKVDVISGGGGGGERSLEVVKNQAAYLKVKCDMLAKEKEHALRKWEKSRQEINDASKMAEALRTAIETLLEAGASDSKADYKTRQDILDDQTQSLKQRMENLRRKTSEGLQSQPLKVKTSSAPLEERVETLKKSSEGRSLASPDIPRDTECKVEALRARLGKLMLATNSRISDEQRQPVRSAREEKNKPVEDWLHQKSYRKEKSELKMKGWLDSLSAELSSDESPTTSTGVCEKCKGAAGFICRDASCTASGFSSKQPTPSSSKQESPWSSTHERGGPGSAISLEETKKNVIHKIAEEVRMEAEQWFQVQDLLGRVGEDMITLQDACSTWERRAILAEAQVVNLQQEGPHKTEKTANLGDEKVAELQKEMLRLRETMHEVKIQVGGIQIDPSGWFEAAHKFGYAFMPLSLHSPDASGTLQGNYTLSTCDSATPGSSAPAAALSESSSSANSSPASIISSSGKTDAETDVMQRSQITSHEWAKETGRVVEEDEMLMAANACGNLDLPNNIIKDMSSASDGKLLGKTSTKLFQEELGLESSDSGGDIQTQASFRERCNSLLQQQEEPL
ncbi:unnamed protein product [Calypogeia fissa]